MMILVPRWLIILSLFTVLIRVRCQLDELGFITIDCGIPENSTYIDTKTNLTYTSDEKFIDTGTNYNISKEYLSPLLSNLYLTVRSFPNGTRNCYTLRSLSIGSKYLIRTSFFYGNYDKLNKLVVFDVYLGVNLWKTVNISQTVYTTVEEVITIIQNDFLQVCLVNTGNGTPFISGLDLRPFKITHYPAANGEQSLSLYYRMNMGPTDGKIIRYPDDVHDRIWETWGADRKPPEWTEISTNSTIPNTVNDLFEAPSAVLQTAFTAAPLINFFWTPKPEDKNPTFVTIFHFSEFQNLINTKAKRQFYINLNGRQIYKPFSPDYLYPDAIYNNYPFVQSNLYNISIIATENSTLPPVINAVEIYRVLYTAVNGSDSGDVTAMTAIKDKYLVTKNWMGDPCLPKEYAWAGLNCSYSIPGPLRITTLNLSSSGLVGSITTAFVNLDALQYLDLSNNSFTGAIPEELAQLASLKFLDLTGNQLDGSVPAALLKKSQDGSLILRIDPIGGNEPLPKKSSTIIVVVVVAVIVLLLVITVVLVRKKALHKAIFERQPEEDHYEKVYGRTSNNRGSSVQLENRQFTYKELQHITNNFGKLIGGGGFGNVYAGYLENGNQVAVKMHSQSSSQGVRQFLAEAQHLTRVHHKHLVCLIGYCKDGDHWGLVYEYMSEGTLEDHLRGQAGNGRSLTWKERLRIALESALGLEYLHTGCTPPLIHRDVKTSNILLNSNLEAKLADFGLSKASHSDTTSGISTAVVGTPGYLDPQYYFTFKSTEKSDVYSFGVVLLEVVTGKAPIFSEPEAVHIIEWVRQRLARGNIENVLDKRMQGECNLNSVWKVTELAMSCTAQDPGQRPTMSEVVAQLKECLILELEHTGSYNMNSSSNNSSNLCSVTAYMVASEATLAFEVEHVSDLSVSTGPLMR